MTVAQPLLKDYFIIEMSTQISRSNSLSGLDAFLNDESSSHEMMAGSGVPPPTPTPGHHQRRSTVPQHSPVVQAMLTSNTLRDCRQVEEMFTKCMTYSSSNSRDSFMCQTAERYFSTCTKK